MSYMEIRNLKKVYNPYGIHPKVDLNGLNFEIEKGDFICIMGTSGSGKTTLVNILSTIDEATHGQILLNQKDLLLLSEKEKANLRKEGIVLSFKTIIFLNRISLLCVIIFIINCNFKIKYKGAMNMNNKLEKNVQNSFMDNFIKTDDILNDMCGIIESSQKAAYQAVNIALVQRNWLIG